jgi:hypothetical protein
MLPLDLLDENSRARRFYEGRGSRRDERRRRAFPPHPAVVAYTIRLDQISPPG